MKWNLWSMKNLTIMNLTMLNLIIMNLMRMSRRKNPTKVQLKSQKLSMILTIKKLIIMK